MKKLAETGDLVKSKHVSKCSKCLHFFFAESIPFIVPDEDDDM